jgi:pimeloyl-ACP methyl ester carboxylesterase
MQTHDATPTRLPEQAGYFAVPGAHLYTVLHQVTDPVARVLLVGPFASERHFSYHPWVRWARYLAARRIEVLRYDYRGVGESTGAFEDMSFEDWREDAKLLAEWIQSRSPGVPLLLHGLEIGGIFAANLFDEGCGDALLLWSPPATANQAMRSSLMHWSWLEQLYESKENRKSAAENIREMEQGSLIEVQGYRWSGRLWRDSFQCALPASMADEAMVSQSYDRPVKIVKLGKEAAPLVKPHLTYDQVKYLGSLYDETFAWVAEALALAAGESHDRIH